MAKMGSGTGLREIPLSQIVDTGNVRADYKEIEELAESIKKVGQLEPILVKVLEPDANGERFEIVAGHRRHLAIKYLCDKKESFTTIKAIVVTGDKLTIQLVENLQRSDLTAAEREKGIYDMCKSGFSQVEVAARLSKPADYVSRNVSAYKIREAGKKAGYDMSKIATATLNEIQSAAEHDYPDLIRIILMDGGTTEAARSAMETYRVAHGKPANPKRAKGGGKETPGISDPLALHPSPATDPIVEELSTAGLETDIDISLPPAENEPPKAAPKTGSKKPAVIPLEDFDPPHLQVDFNTVCLAIMRYAKDNAKAEKNCMEVAKDILSLLHTELC